MGTIALRPCDGIGVVASHLAGAIDRVLSDVLRSRGVRERLRALPSAPPVVLISTTDRSDLAAELGVKGFLAKADIRAATIAQMLPEPFAGFTRT